jgi:transcription elongation factor GreA
MLKDPDIVEGAAASEIAAAGVMVTVRPLDEADPEEETYLLAASKEERANAARTVSLDSPFGRALEGRRVGDRVEYEAPGGRFSYEIVSLAPRA